MAGKVAGTLFLRPGDDLRSYLSIFDNKMPAGYRPADILKFPQKIFFEIFAPVHIFENFSKMLKNISEPKSAGWPGKWPYHYPCDWNMFSDHILLFLINICRPDIDWPKI